jgi:hypothetical protein
MINYKEILMTDIVHDYAEIAKALKGDNWWRVKPTVEAVPVVDYNPYEVAPMSPKANAKAISPLDHLRYTCPLCGHTKEIINDSNRRSQCCSCICCKSLVGRYKYLCRGTFT